MGRVDRQLGAVAVGQGPVSDTVIEESGVNGLQARLAVVSQEHGGLHRDPRIEAELGVQKHSVPVLMRTAGAPAIAHGDGDQRSGFDHVCSVLGEERPRKTLTRSKLAI
jgi:hypothetical protein